MSFETPTPAAPIREISDVQTLRALAHPVRAALIELLSLEGPLTATQASERIGESPSNCSFHLRQLAKYGFVEEADGARGRSRPWRMKSIGMRVTSTEDAESEMAVAAVARIFRERAFARYHAWLEDRGAYSSTWRQAAVDSEFVFFLTEEELRTLTEELVTRLAPLYRDRLTDPAARPPGALPVEMLLLAYPIAPEGDS